MKVMDRLVIGINELWCVWSVSKNGENLIKHPGHYLSKERAQLAAESLAMTQDVTIYAIRQADAQDLVRGAGLD